jgi:hypothetical protein
MIRAFWQGMKDGFNEPYDLSSGMTYEDRPQLNEVYDYGVNLGQFLRAGFNAQNWQDEEKP